MMSAWVVFLLLAPVLGQNVDQAQYDYPDQRNEQWSEAAVISQGPWVVVGDNSDPFTAQQSSPQRNPLG